MAKQGSVVVVLEEYWIMVVFPSTVVQVIVCTNGGELFYSLVRQDEDHLTL